MIDAIGGVEVNVERNMKYTDPTQDLYIDIDEGLSLERNIQQMEVEVLAAMTGI